jgi:hypothetical protein
MMTQEQKQAYFDAAVAGLASQGFTRAVHDGGSCAYRGVGGKKCALGHLIPDERYEPEMEGGVNAAVRAVLGRDDIEDDFYWFSKLQNCHDLAYTLDSETGTTRRFDSPNDMKRKLVQFAESEGLSLPGVLR